MPRVCHVITSLATGGAETALFRLVTAANRTDPPPLVVSLTDEGVYGPRLRESGVPVVALGMARGRFSLAAFVALVRLLRRERPDVVQTWLYHSDLLGLLAARLAGGAAVAWNIRCSVTDARYVRGQAGLVVWLLARLSRAPVLVISNSEAGRRVHESLGYRPRRWAIVPNGLDTALFRPDPAARGAVRGELGLPADAMLVGLVARYDPLKDYATFLRTAAAVSARAPAAHFVAVGAEVTSANGPLMALVHELGLAGRIHLLGERRDTPRLNAAFDIAMCTSTGEGFPNVLIEAMACGVPCVSTDVGDAALVIAETGRVAPAADPTALAAAVLALAEAGDVARATLGAAARRRVEANYALPTMVARYRALHDELAGAPTPYETARPR